MARCEAAMLYCFPSSSPLSLPTSCPTPPSRCKLFSDSFDDLSVSLVAMPLRPLPL